MPKITIEIGTPTQSMNILALQKLRNDFQGLIDAGLLKLTCQSEHVAKDYSSIEEIADEIESLESSNKNIIEKLPRNGGMVVASESLKENLPEEIEEKDFPPTLIALRDKYKGYLDQYNAMAIKNGLPYCRRLGKNRLTKMQDREAEGMFNSWPFIVEQLPFTKSKLKPQIIDFDWILEKGNWNVVIEGKYDNNLTGGMASGS
jgi:hypothetical protein